MKKMLLGNCVYIYTQQMTFLIEAKTFKFQCFKAKCFFSKVLEITYTTEITCKTYIFYKFSSSFLYLFII